MTEQLKAHRAGPIWAAAATVLALLTGCAASSAGSGGSTSPESAQSTPTRTTGSSGGDFAVDPLPSSARTVLQCGRPFHRPPGAQLVVTADFPAVVRVSEAGVDGLVQVRAPAGGMSGVVTPTADVFLVRANEVATLPAPQDLVGAPLRLGSGQSKTMPAHGVLVPCDPSLAGSDLRPGAYQVWVRVTVNRADGTQVDSFGGPWSLEVR